MKQSIAEQIIKNGSAEEIADLLGGFLFVKKETKMPAPTTPATPAELKKRWEGRLRALVGLTVTALSYQTDEEVENHGWNSAALVLQFQDGTQIYASRDDEGNDAGALFISPSKLAKAQGLPECAPVI